jgi:hypothetical protein
MGRAYRVALSLAFALNLTVIASTPVYAEPSLAGLLHPAPRAYADALLEQLIAIERRAYAMDASVQRALLHAREQLAFLRAARAQAAPRAVLQRHEALVWAALSWADRAEARARTAAVLAGLAARAAAAEASAWRARTALEHERASTQAKGSAAESAR